MIALLSAFLPFFVRLFPIVLAVVTKNVEERKRALEQFNKWVEQHKSDGLLSTSLRKQADDQKADLKRIAEARDAALTTPADPGPIVSPAGQVGPTGNLAAPAKSPVPSVPLNSKA